MWIRSEKKKNNWYKRASRLLGWLNLRKLRVLWMIPRLRSWTWHQYSLFSSIQLHQCKKWQWSCKNTSSLLKKTNKNQPKPTFFLFGVFADVSLHKRKTIKSSFQSNPGPTVLDGFRTTRLSDSSHDNVLPCQRWRCANFLIRKFFVSDTGIEPGTPGPSILCLDHCATEAFVALKWNVVFLFPTKTCENFQPNLRWG